MVARKGRWVQWRTCRWDTVAVSIPAVHCIENQIYVFPEKESRLLSPNSYSHVSFSNFYIPRIGPDIRLQQNSQTDPGSI
jgi:hypothetical protein